MTRLWAVAVISYLPVVVTAELLQWVLQDRIMVNIILKRDKAFTE